jgi:hypothetical protein
MTSLQDTARAILGRVPALLATAGITARVPTSAPGVEPRTYAAPVAVTGQFNARGSVQEYDETRGVRLLISRAHLTVSDDVVLPEFTQVTVPVPVSPLYPAGTQTWTLGVPGEPHQNRLGTITYVLSRTDVVSAGGQR